MKKLEIRLNPSGGGGMIHDSRSDVRALAKVCNVLVDKVNELVEKINNSERIKQD